LRILDSKNPAMQDIIGESPKLLDRLSGASREHFERLQRFLQESGIEYAIDPRLVRGLDYYNRTVFEWVTDRLGAQGTVAAADATTGSSSSSAASPRPRAVSRSASSA
jgi:histidyl-tRNA synthetase